jgi:hypothetical protein
VNKAQANTGFYLVEVNRVSLPCLRTSNGQSQIYLGFHLSLHPSSLVISQFRELKLFEWQFPHMPGTGL